MTEVPSLPPVDWAAPPGDRLDQLERQMVRGSHFTQAVLDKLMGRIAGAEAFLTELVEVLRARGVIVDGGGDDGDDAAGAQPQPQPEAEVPGEEQTSEEQPGEEEPESQMPVNWPGVAFRVDPEDQPPPAEVNCAERMHICHAVCCKLGFALTPAEVESGTVKWDLGFPYMIRHEANGYCSHNDTATGRCSIYADRPSLCRRYSCAGDTRIWKDFDAMVLNEEWIREHLAGRSRILLRTNLPIMEVNGQKGAAPT